MEEIRQSPVEGKEVYPILYRVLYIPGGCLGFLNQQQYHICNSSHLPPTTIPKGNSPNPHLSGAMLVSGRAYGFVWHDTIVASTYLHEKNKNLRIKFQSKQVQQKHETKANNIISGQFIINP